MTNPQTTQGQETRITFEDLVAHGIASGGNIVRGMPWSFAIPVTHENDDCYLICTAKGTLRFTRGDVLTIQSESSPTPRSGGVTGPVCGDQRTMPGGQTVLHCAKPHGHADRHEAANGIWWASKSPTPQPQPSGGAPPSVPTLENAMKRHEAMRAAFWRLGKADEIGSDIDRADAEREANKAATALAFTLSQLHAAAVQDREWREKVEAALLEVCHDNTPEAIGEPDPELGRYVCMNEDGDPLVDTDDPAEAIREINGYWGMASEALEKERARADEAEDAAVQGAEDRERSLAVTEMFRGLPLPRKLIATLGLPDDAGAAAAIEAVVSLRADAEQWRALERESPEMAGAARRLIASVAQLRAARQPRQEGDR